MTPNSSPTPYCPATEFFKGVDLRTVADWASDDGDRVGGSPNPDPVILAANENVKSVLSRASGMFESALLKGNRYQPADILLLIGLQPDGVTPVPGFAPTAGTHLVYEIITRLAEGLIWRRRPDLSPYPPLFDWAMEMLQDLRDGGAILPFAEVQAAGLPGHHVEVVADIEPRGLVVVQSKRFLGTRGAELNG